MTATPLNHLCMGWALAYDLPLAGALFILGQRNEARKRGRLITTKRLVGHLGFHEISAMQWSQGEMMT